MKDPFDRAKVVLRHLPPAITQTALMEQIDGMFSGRYRWACFRPGKNNLKNQQYSRVYIDFKRPEDVVEFAEFFDGHIFVNEKGAQFKALVEYAPSQRVPKPCSKKDGREGTIFKDPEYLEFHELVTKPVENLPSAEIQLERREAERAGSAKDTLIVTPLMDFIRQKRAAKSETQRSSGRGKLGRRSGVVSVNSSGSSSKRGSEKRRGPNSMYVVRDNRKNGGGKDKSTYILVQRREEQQTPVKSVSIASSSGTYLVQDETANGVDGTISGASVETGKRRLLLLKGKEREDFHVFGGLSQQPNVISSVRNSPGSTAVKQNQQHETSGRNIRTILSYKGGRHTASSSVPSQSEQQLQTVNLEKDKPPPQPSAIRQISRDQICSRPLASVSDGDCKKDFDNDVTSNDQHGSVPIIQKNDKRTKNKDRPDRGVWTPFRRSDRSHAREETPFELGHMLSDSLQGVSASQHSAEAESESGDMGFHNARVGCGSNSQAAYDMPLGLGELKSNMTITSKSAEIRNIGGVDNGSRRHVGRRGPTHGLKEVDSSLNLAEVKASKRGGTGYGSHERRVWIQKSGSAS